MAEGILLDSGTNEMEMLIFNLGTTFFGINVAKVREIIQRKKTVKIPQSPKCVEGSFQLREQVLTLVNLGKYLNMEGEETKAGNGLIIVVEFNQYRCGILVDKVEVIRRFKWSDIDPPSDFLTAFNIPITGSVKDGANIVLIVDFETIIDDVLGVKSAPEPVGISNKACERKDLNILFADDSLVIRKSVTNILHKYGFTNLIVCNDGQHAWDTLVDIKSKGKKMIDLVISDIEMPGMDGLHLTKRIKDDTDLQKIPVVLFSSLITKDNIKKCESVGADAQVSKPDSTEMIKAIEKCLEKKGITLAQQQA